MGVITDVVGVTITAEVSKATQEGFGLPLILSQTAAWAEFTREYTNITDIALDFATSSAEYKAAAKIFGQNPRPPSLLIGRCTAKATQRWAITPSAVNSGVYKMKVNGTEVSFTADSSATVTEIIAGLKAAIDALSLAITVSDQTTYMRVVANVAGAFFSLSTTDTKLQLVQDHADPGVATDLANIAIERNDWYGLITTHNSKDVIMAAAAYIEAASKVYVAQTQDTSVPNTTLSGTDDVGEAAKAAGYKKTFVIFSKATDDFADAGIMGKCFPYVPGEETWKFKELAGVEVGSYTATQRTNMRSKKVNFYEVTAGVSMTEEGYAASGQYFDLSRYLDYLISRVSSRVFGRIAALPKVGMDDEGIAIVVSELTGQLQADEVRGVLLPGWTVSYPKAADISAGDRSARLLQNINFEAVYSGAVHKVLIQGVVVA